VLVEVDTASSNGQKINVEWRQGRGSSHAEDAADLPKPDGQLADRIEGPIQPADAKTVSPIKPEIFVAVGICTHSDARRRTAPTSLRRTSSGMARWLLSLLPPPDLLPAPTKVFRDDLTVHRTSS
jgi:hypothetical protein